MPEATQYQYWRPKSLEEIEKSVGAIVNYLFNRLGKHRVYGSVDPRNTPSAAVLERLGFRREAHFIQSVYMHGEWCDDCVYAILSKEWNRFGR